MLLTVARPQSPEPTPEKKCGPRPVAPPGSGPQSMPGIAPLLRGILAVIVLALIQAPIATAIAAEAPASYEEFSDGKTRLDGYFPLLVDPVTARVFMEIPRDRGEFIFQTSLPRGVGSNDLGLDRGQLGDTRLVRFERIGIRMLLRERNTRYRADSDNAAERRSVEEAFASSVIAGFEVVAEDAARSVIDYTPFLLTDTHAIGEVLDDAKEGTFSVDAERSAPFPDRIRAFPRNTELEAVLTLEGRADGPHLPTVAPSPAALTVHTHHSLIALPEPGYRIREFHPFSGFWPLSWLDYAQPIAADMVRRVIPRHRLEKQDPGAARSRPVEPIVYYLDPGVPEPVRSALLDGALWWNAAFEALGYIDAFQVRMLPEDADPMDVRYNVIQWVHRSTRGWSYGSSVRDPRTGEILKGHVTLGSLRVRQDLLIARALTAPFADDADADAEARLESMALARIRQLSAHEVGHTLGIAHNFAASATKDGGSVMDYPHPRIAMNARGEITLDAAYDVGLGAWDRHAITYGYADLAPEEEADGLARIIAEAQDAGMRFISDADARPTDGAHPVAHLWDNGSDATAELQRLLEVRRRALATLGADALQPGQPLSDLAELLVPVYYLHRYQTEAVAKLVGGVDYRYALRGDGLPAAQTAVGADAQQLALDALLATLDPAALTLDADLLTLLLPKAYGWRATRESPPGRTGLTFDAVTPAEAAAEHTLALLFDPGRLARLAQQHAHDPALPGLTTLFDRVLATTSTRDDRSAAGLAAEIAARIEWLAVEHLLLTAWGAEAPPEIAARARIRLADLEEELGRVRRGDAAARAADLAAVLRRAREDGRYSRRDDVAQMPPGSPI